MATANGTGQGITGQGRSAGNARCGMPGARDKCVTEKRSTAIAALLLVAAAVASASTPASATGAGGQDGRALAGNDLRRAIAGKRVYLAVPLGGEFPLFYRADGRVDGSGEAVGLGRFLKPSDSGRWWVDGGRLCQQWQTWYSGRVFCFTVTEHGPGRIGWVRDDGERGVARLAD